MAFTISISITGDEKDYTAAIKAAQQETAKLTQETDRASQAMQRHEQASVHGRTALIPFTAATSQLTLLLSNQFGPAAAIAASTIDRFAIHTAAAQVAGKGLMGALASGVGAALNPWVFAITAGAAALAAYVDNTKEAKKAQEDFQKALATGDVGFFKSKLAEARIELERLTAGYQKFVTAQNARPTIDPNAGPPAARAAQLQAARDAVDRKIKSDELRGAQEKVATATDNLATAQRNEALDAIKGTTAQIDLQTKLLAATEMQRPAIQAEIDALNLKKNILNDTDIAEQRAALNRKASAEQAKIALSQQINLLNAQKASLALQSQIAETGGAGDPSTLAKNAIDADTKANILAATLAGKLTPALRSAYEENGKFAKALIEAKDKAKIADDEYKIMIGLLQDIQEAEQLAAEIPKRQQKEAIDTAKQLNDLEADRLDLIGRGREAERLRIQNQIKNLNDRLNTEEGLGGGGDVINKQIEVLQTKLNHLDDVTLDIGQHVTNTLKTMFDGLISGTLKGFDVLKATSGLIGNIFTDLFSQVLKKKLSFETTLISNVQGLPNQLNSAIASGETSAGSPSGGGFLSSILGGGGSSGGGGGILGQLGNVIGAFLPSSLGGAGGVGGALGTAMGAGGLGSLFGGSNGNMLSSIGSIGGSLLSMTGIGESIMTGVFDLLTAGGTSFLGFGGAAAAGVAGELIGDFLLPGIGSLIGILLSFLMKTAVPVATIKIKTAFDGLSATPFGFMAGQAVSDVVKASNVSKSMQNAIRTQTESIAETVVGGVGDLLNILPKEIQKQVEPLISASNKAAEALLTFKISAPVTDFAAKVKKFMSNLTYRLLAAYSDPLIEALRLELDKIGFDFGTFSPSENPVMPKKPKKGEPVIGTPTDLPSQFIDNMLLYISQQKKKDRGDATSKVMDAEQKVFELAEQLRAIAPIMTAEQKKFIGAGFSNVLSAGSPAEVDAAIARFQRQFGPLIDFLSKALQESADLFGRGIMAALDAVNESTALLNFNKALGQGAKDILYQGITEALTNAANFQTFLAPIQQLIHQFIQNSVETGQPPDIAAFRSALLPLVEAFSSRVELLQPLIAQLNAFGLDIKDALSPLTGPVNGTIVNININGNVSSEEDAETLGNTIGRFLSGATLPN